MAKMKSGQKSALEGASGGIFLIGLGILFLSKVDFFPWILVVIGVSILTGRQQAGCCESADASSRS